jgi:hypothetical protein
MRGAGLPTGRDTPSRQSSHQSGTSGRRWTDDDKARWEADAKAKLSVYSSSNDTSSQIGLVKCQTSYIQSENKDGEDEALEGLNELTLEEREEWYLQRALAESRALGGGEWEGQEYLHDHGWPAARSSSEDKPLPPLPPI